MSDLTSKLISWYLINKRDLPWRTTVDPYRIWLSEIILQQTRVEQGTPYYYSFLENFPTVFDLAGASEDAVLKLWQGLGYYSRARNLHATAKLVAFTMNGRFPESYGALKKLKGVGDYTASAIASFCFGEAAAVVDGNVYRVLSRVFGIDTPIDSSAGQKEFKVLAQELIDPERPATFNQAMMEFGAIQCKPKNPYCLHCPFNDRCLAFAENKIDQLPVKKGKTRVRDRHFNYLVLNSKEKKTVLQQRTEKGIWQGLYEFPLVETQVELQEQEFNDLFKNTPSTTRTTALLLAAISQKTVRLYDDAPILHKLSHQNLYVKFWIVDAEVPEGIAAISVDRVVDYAVPRVIDRFLERFDFG